eukprot:UN28184
MTNAMDRIKAFIGTIILASPWVLGIPFVIFCVWVIYSSTDFLVRGGVFICLSILCFLPLPRAGKFRDLLEYLNPRKWAKNTGLIGNIDEIDNEKSMLVYHPHGVLCVGYSIGGAWAPELREKGIKFLITKSLRYAPLFRWICELHGEITDASKENLVKLMKQGK